MSNAKFIVGQTGGQIDLSIVPSTPASPGNGFMTIFAGSTAGISTIDSAGNVINYGSGGGGGGSGTSGTSGTSGSSGTSGASGSSGSAGTSGTDGTSGSSGTSGTDGTSGSSGTSGTSGSSGTSGISIAGPTGAAGLGLSAKNVYIGGTAGWYADVNTPVCGPYPCGYRYDVTFSEPFADTLYSVDIETEWKAGYTIFATGAVASNSGGGATTAILNKTVNGFTIEIFEGVNFYQYYKESYAQCIASGESAVIGIGLSARNLYYEDTDFVYNVGTNNYELPVAFTQSFASTNYSIDVQYKNGTNGRWYDFSNTPNIGIENKTASGFDLVLLGGFDPTGYTDWYVQAIALGETSVAGESGSSGTSGTSGFSGTSGVNGATGATGATGAAGLGLNAKVLPWAGTGGWAQDPSDGYYKKNFTYAQPFASTDYAVDFFFTFENSLYGGTTGGSSSLSDTSLFGIIGIQNKTTSGVTIATSQNPANFDVAGAQGYLQCVASGESAVIGVGLSTKNIEWGGTAGWQYGATAAPGGSPGSYYDVVFDAPFGSTNYTTDFFYQDDATAYGWAANSIWGSTQTTFQNKTASGVRVTQDNINIPQNASATSIWNLKCMALGEVGVPGESGSSGTSGTSGSSGTSGTSGVNGSTGSIGATGATGVGLGLLAKNINASGTGGWVNVIPQNLQYYDFTFAQPFASTDYSVDVTVALSNASPYTGVTGSAISNGNYGMTEVAITNKTTSGFRYSIIGFDYIGYGGGEVYATCIATGETGVPTQGPVGPTGANGTNGATGATGADTSIVNNSTKTANYTFALTDVNTMVIGASGAALTFTIPTNATVAFPTGSQILAARGGTGALGVTGAAGVTLNSAQSYKNLNNQYSGATLIKQDTDTWYMFGDLKA